MELKNYYEILGVAPDATVAQIKAAYRKLARKYHPDVSKEADAESRFKDINEAQEILGDAAKRAQYDELRRMGSRPSREGFRSYGPGPSASANPSAFADLFDQLFGGRDGGPRGPASTGARAGDRGEDLVHPLEISLEEAFHGAQRELSLRHGDQSRKLKVRIPAGARPGQRLRLKNQGGPGWGAGAPGDLYLEFRYAPHPRYQVDGNDLRLVLPISPWEAAFGAHATVPTLGGEVKLKIPEGAQSGQRLRLKARGIPGASAGDLIVELRIHNPPMHTDAARDAMKALAASADFDPRAGW